MQEECKINSFKFASYPTSFIEELKKSCIYRESSSKFENLYGRSDYERTFFQLNRLESYLLKEVIPFIRIGHCPRGPYLKLKGDLILISSNLEHSLSKVLPVTQELIPVCFKRKLSYSGSYIEEVVEKKKVQMYFDFLKKYNHLYKNLTFDSKSMDHFIDETIATASQFEGTICDQEESPIIEEGENVDDTFDTFEDK